MVREGGQASLRQMVLRRPAAVQGVAEHHDARGSRQPLHGLRQHHTCVVHWRMGGGDTAPGGQHGSAESLTQRGSTPAPQSALRHVPLERPVMLGHCQNPIPRLFSE